MTYTRGKSTVGNTIQNKTNEIRSNSMTVLEYPKILDQLFKYIHFSLDEPSTKSLEPSYSIKDASLKQHETTEAVTESKSENKQSQNTELSKTEKDNQEVVNGVNNPTEEKSESPTVETENSDNEQKT